MTEEIEQEVERYCKKQVLTRSDIVNIELIVQDLKTKIKNLKQSDKDFVRFVNLLGKASKIKNREDFQQAVELSEQKTRSRLSLQAKTPKRIIPLTPELRERSTEKMANFDFGVGLRLDTLEEIYLDKVENFLALAECYYNTLSAQGKIDLIKFLIAGKIKGIAKNRLGNSTVTTLADLKTELLSKVVAQESSESLQKKLTAIRQGRKSLTEFAHSLENLASRLAATMVREHVTEDKATAPIINYHLVTQLSVV